MKRVVNLWLWLALLVGLSGAVFAQERSAPPYKLAAMTAQVFDEKDNTFRAVEDGEGFNNALNLSLFVSLQVNGAAGSYEDKRKVQITVTEGKRAILTRTGYLGVFSEQGRYFVPLWIYGSLCETVTVKARLLGQKTVSTLTGTYNFHCGE